MVDFPFAASQLAVLNYVKRRTPARVTGMRGRGYEDLSRHPTDGI
jgi:hypothetical protein